MKIGIFLRENNIIGGTVVPPTENAIAVEVENISDIVLGVSKYIDGAIVNPTEAELDDIKNKELEATKQLRYENRAVELLRQKYSLNQELAILRQRDTKPEEYAEYNAYAEQCKATAKGEILEV